MEVAAVAQKLSQEHLQSLSASRVVVEPCHADPSLLETLQLPQHAKPPRGCTNIWGHIDVWGHTNVGGI